MTSLNSTIWDNFTGNNTYIEDDGDLPVVVTILKAVMVAVIIVAAVVGNILVIVSVLRFERLRILANSFICSLAFADLFVALTVMTFSASQELMKRWVFGPVLCNLFNANDVMFSTASLTHLCCISMDRYIAIMDPFRYEAKMTRRRAAIMLAMAWSASALISHVPIHLGWYSTPEAREKQSLNPDACMFEVNKIYAVISSTISFWIPTFIMVFVYVKIYREARRQEQRINQLTINMGSVEKLDQVGSSNGVTSGRREERPLQDRKKMKREHKAAKTLGIIMGGFLCCWLPFFLWYVISTLCDTCNAPDILVSILFWIGYMNSAINPVIYAFFNRDFRNAFRKLLGLQHARIFCNCKRCPGPSCQGHRRKEIREDHHHHNRNANNLPSTPPRHTYEAVGTDS